MAKTKENIRNRSLRPLQNLHLRRISVLCAARSLAYLYDMSVPQGFLAFTFAALLRLELHPHLRVLQRSQAEVSDAG
ncbi:ATP-dependent exonuclease synthesis protein AddB [Neisseria shayeganii 871]|uniref:ATP-dependent exonuclease synthesis protein AddB n=1 Tax=Neisseria shayeganii 871 TaxID=1032488 RepID=G4CIW4_9NEIS|nr:ATP-dependent exonuclease synthesis protein AddB [Neisseria shayeganii 871]